MNLSPRNGFWLFATVTIIYSLIMGQAIKPLNSKQIVDFEFAGTVPQAQQMLDTWSTEGMLAKVYLSIYLDFIFPILYTLTLYFALSWAASTTRNSSFQAAARKINFWIWLAPLADYIENVGMLLTLTEPTNFSVTLSFYFAAIKFFIILLAIAFVVVVTFSHVISKQLKV